MQMLHTHEAVQVSEGGSDKQLVCGQYETHCPPEAVLTVWNWHKREGKHHERLEHKHTLLINHICNTTQMY